jgi:hypothetical protein
MPGNQLFVADRDLTLHRRPARMGVSFQLQKLTELSEHHLQVFAALGVSAHPVLRNGDGRHLTRAVAGLQVYELRVEQCALSYVYFNARDRCQC